MPTVTEIHKPELLGGTVEEPGYFPKPIYWRAHVSPEQLLFADSLLDMGKWGRTSDVYRGASETTVADIPGGTTATASTAPAPRWGRRSKQLLPGSDIKELEHVSAYPTTDADCI